MDSGGSNVDIYSGSGLLRNLHYRERGLSLGNAVSLPCVMEAVIAAHNYKETALLEEIRIIRGNLDRPQVLTADIARLFTYGDPSRNLALKENDVIYVPREALGDALETAKKLLPIVQMALAPLQGVFATKLLVNP